MASATSDTEYVLYYWPITFRGNLIRCFLTYHEISYVDAPVQDLVALRQRNTDLDGPLFMAPPLLFDKQADVYLSQTPAIISYISRKYLSHSNHLQAFTQDIVKLSMADKVVCDCNDILNEITSNCGHDTMWTAEKWEGFISERFIKWLKIMEGVYAKFHVINPSSQYLLGTDVATYADTTLVATFLNMERSLPPLKPILRKNAPNIMNICDIMMSNSIPLRELFEKQSSWPYCGGQIEKSLRSMLESSPYVLAQNSST